MSSKWKEMSTKDKIFIVLYLFFSVVAITFAILDIADVFKYGHSYWLFAFAVTCALDAYKNWGTKRKSAIVELVCAIAMVVLGVTSFFF